MASNAAARTPDTDPGDAACDPRTAVTRSLLGYGVVAGPFYLILGVGQGLFRDGFDFRRHALSHLANGPWGWIQTVNFALTGLMVIAAAVGIARALRPRGRPGAWFLGSYGACVLAASVFRADPVDGFPPGTPEGMPTTISSMGLAHFASGALGFLSLALAGLALAVTFKRRDEPGMALLSGLASASVLLGFFGPMMIPGMPGGIAGIWFAVVVGWVWLAVTSVHLYRTTR